MSSLRRTTVGIARKYPRVPLIAASVATVGALGAASFAVGAAPWAQAVGNVAKTAQGDLPSSAASSPVSAGGTKLDAIRADAKANSTAAAAATDRAPAKQQAAKPAAAKQQAPRQQPAKPAAAKSAAAKPAVARPAVAKRAVAKPAAAKPKAAAVPAQPYLIYDSVSPGTIPAGKAAAVYSNGAYAASSAQVAGHNSVLWIDTNGSNPAANVLDVEPGDATPVGAAQWVKQRLTSQPHEVAIVYTMISQWQQVKDNVAALPAWMQSKVRYWIADPTGVPHVLAGANATQWYWGNSYDITTANPDFVH